MNRLLAPPRSLCQIARMFKRWKAARKARKRARELEKKLAELQNSFPDCDWKPFQEVSREFMSKSMSSLEEQAFLYRLCCQLPPDAQVIEIGSWIGHSACLIGVALRGPRARCYAIDAFTGLTDKPSEVAYYRNFLKKVSAHKTQRELFDDHIAHFHLQDKVTALAASPARPRNYCPPISPAPTSSSSTAATSSPSPAPTPNFTSRS